MTESSLTDLLKQAQVPDALLNPLSLLFKKRTYKPGDQLLRPGSVWDTIYVQTSGFVRLYYLDDQGEELNKSFVFSGFTYAPVGQHALTSPSDFCIEAILETTVYQANYTQFRRILDTHPEGARFYIKMMGLLLEEKIMREKLFLISNATDRYLYFLKTYEQWSHLISQKHMASFIGISNISLSRIRRSLKLTRKNH